MPNSQPLTDEKNGLTISLDHLEDWARFLYHRYQKSKIVNAEATCDDKIGDCKIVETVRRKRAPIRKHVKSLKTTVRTGTR